LAAVPVDSEAVAAVAARMTAMAQRRLGRSLALHVVDTGSCGGCELELRALRGVVYDLERFGLRFAASPRHADVLLITGPVTHNLRNALEQTWRATPDPKWVVAVGDCAVDGGVFKSSYATLGGVETVVPIDLMIRGCPPSPAQLLLGLRALLEAGAEAQAAPA
jgi:Ni,Fe-hydrogenase III small subunit